MRYIIGMVGISAIFIASPIAAAAQACASMPSLAGTPLCQTMDTLPQPSNTPNPAQSLNVVLNVTSDGSGTPTISVHTNLPEGTQLEVSLSQADGTMDGQVDATVQKGSIRAGPFSSSGRSLNSGTYSVEVTSGDAELQPAAIQAVIGSDGGNMRGQAVVPDTFQPGHRVIDETFQITVP